MYDIQPFLLSNGGISSLRNHSAGSLKLKLNAILTRPGRKNL